jgi:uncharacterized membrane protein YagU involved in acid resistance
MTRLVGDVPVPGPPTPVAAAVRGAVGGVAATLLLSVLARVLPGMRDRPPGRPVAAAAPSDPFDPAVVQEWQARAQTPALGRGRAHGPHLGHRFPPPGSPGGALVQVEAPGPEGLAAQFAFKVALGVFDKDIAGQLRPVGFGVHVLYGTLWGALFGIAQGTYHRRPGPAGALYGLLVWLIGPALLVPAMKLMQSPAAEPPVRTASMIAGHVAYGVALAAAYKGLEGAERRDGEKAWSR